MLPFFERKVGICCKFFELLSIKINVGLRYWVVDYDGPLRLKNRRSTPVAKKGNCRILLPQADGRGKCNEVHTVMYAGDINPTEAWAILEREKDARLVDVRTRAEWSFVGVPDLTPISQVPVLVEWQTFPDMACDPDFGTTLLSQAGSIGSDQALLFLCRSGARSRSAAVAMTQQGFTRCYNIADGFEGPMDDNRHRGGVAGWKADGLPWVQG